MAKISSANRKFVNVYEIQFMLPPQDNIVTCIGTYEGVDNKTAKAAFETIRQDEKFQDNRYSVQLEDFDGYKIQKDGVEW